MSFLPLLGIAHGKRQCRAHRPFLPSLGRKICPLVLLSHTQTHGRLASQRRNHQNTKNHTRAASFGPARPSILPPFVLDYLPRNRRLNLRRMQFCPGALSLSFLLFFSVPACCCGRKGSPAVLLNRDRESLARDGEENSPCTAQLTMLWCGCVPRGYVRS